MKTFRTTEQEATEDIFFGQLVIIYARWFVVIAMTILVLWSSDTLNQMVIGIALVVPPNRHQFLCSWPLSDGKTGEQAAADSPRHFRCRSDYAHHLLLAR